jgi:Chaperone of endosialidase
MNTEASLTTNSMNRSSLRSGFLLMAVAFFCFALAPVARAACQQGCLTNDNTVLGDDALFSLTTGLNNTAIGFNALYHNTTGNANTANGWSALFNNTTGFTNTATGVYALISNTTGFLNTAIGGFALGSNTTGFENTAIGNNALFGNTTGVLNTASGFQVLSSNTTGAYNTANGAYALDANTTGSNNTAIGGFALRRNTTGEGNTANGSRALVRNTTGNDNIALGNNAGENLTTGSSNIDIGNRGVAGETRTIRVGTTGTHTAAYIAGISGATVPTGVAVIVDANGQLGTTTSTARYKEAIRPMDKASEAVLALKPVTFHYKHELDPDSIPQFGLIAEDVEKVNPDLVVRDAEGKVNTVRYEAVNAMLLNEFLKEHRKVEDLQTTIEQQQKDFHAALTEQEEAIQTLKALVLKVSARLEASQSAPRLVDREE